MVNGVKIELSRYIQTSGQYYKVYVGPIFIGTAKMTENGIFVDKYLYDQQEKS